LRKPLVHDETNFTYRQLDRYSSAIAAQLVKLRVTPGNSVALCVDRSIHAVAAMLGVFKAGAAFVPIDPSFPQERIAYMLADAQATVALCDPHYAERFELPGVTVELLRPDAINAIEESAAAHQTSPLSSDDRAYIMYTSGSTGKPKGVPIGQPLKKFSRHCWSEALSSFVHHSEAMLR